MATALSAVYAIANSVNGNMYIGSSVNYVKRWRAHKRELRNGTHHSQPLQRAHKRYGDDALDFSVVEYVDNQSRLIEREQVWMDFFKSKYNICKHAGGSQLGRIPSAETREKMSAAQKGKKRPPFTAEHRAKLSASSKGRAGSPLAIARMRAANLGNKYNLGKKFSEEHRKNLSISKIGNSNSKGYKYPIGAYASRRHPLRGHYKQRTML